MTPPLKGWLWLFFLALVADLAAIYFQWNEVRYISKPLIVLSLFIYFVLRTRSFPGTIYFKMALLFSLAGDIALLFEDRSPLFFMLGLGSFLFAHINYMIALSRIRRVYLHRQSSQPSASRLQLQWGWIIATVLYVGILLYTLLPYLGELKIPVIVYACILGAMLIAVVHAFPRLYAKPGVVCLAGALLFVISDSILAINKFYMGFPLSGLAIMLTYGLAQYLLVRGAAANYLNPNFAPHRAT